MDPLSFSDDGEFKILQLADLHFTNEEGTCRDIPVDVILNTKMILQKLTFLVFVHRWSVMGMPQQLNMWKNCWTEKNQTLWCFLEITLMAEV